VRAIFEGLTDYDPQTLAPVPGVATHWESSNDGRVWTFYLRDDAHWSNGEKVTANDFVRSWERTIKIGQLSPHTELLGNIAGASVSTVRQKPLKDQSVTTNHGFGAEALSEFEEYLKLDPKGQHSSDVRELVKRIRAALQLTDSSSQP